MSDAGSAMMGIGIASGDNRAVEAAEQAISSPLLEETITGAKGVIFNVTGGSDLTLFEINEAASVIYNAVDPEANIIFGSVIDEKLQGDVMITVIATGFRAREEADIFKAPVQHIAAQKAQKSVQQKPSVPSIDVPDFLQGSARA
jgi:cell division protein FtsZ